MRVTKKIFTRAATKKKNYLIEFFIRSLHLKTTLTALFFVEKQRALTFIVWREKKRKFVRMNLLAEFSLFVLFETKNIYSHTHSTYAGG